MHLLLRRSQYDAGWFDSSIVFEINARLDLNPDEQELFERYGLHDIVVYDSDTREQYAHSAQERYESATNPAAARKPAPTVSDAIAGQFITIAGQLWDGAVAVTYGLFSQLSLRITLGSLIEGQHVESNNLEEILAVKKAITDAVEYLANYLQVAVTFDGREELTEYGND